MSSPYFTRLGQQPGVQVDQAADAVDAMMRSAIADRVAAAPLRSTRGRIDKAFIVDRNDVELRLGPCGSNLVRKENEAMLQAVDALNAGASGLVVSRLVPASASKFYVSITLGSLMPS